MKFLHITLSLLLFGCNFSRIRPSTEKPTISKYRQLITHKLERSIQTKIFVSNTGEDVLVIGPEDKPKQNSNLIQGVPIENGWYTFYDLKNGRKWEKQFDYQKMIPNGPLSESYFSFFKDGYNETQEIDLSAGDTHKIIVSNINVDKESDNKFNQVHLFLEGNWKERERSGRSGIISGDGPGKSWKAKFKVFTGDLVIKQNGSELLRQRVTDLEVEDIRWKIRPIFNGKTLLFLDWKTTFSKKVEFSIWAVDLV